MPIAVLTGFHLQSITMGLDARFSWSFIDQKYIIVGCVLYLFSLLFSTWAMYVNHHFEANVRIQKDRNHQVISTGPYAIIRHPGYLAFIVGSFAIPLIIGSIYGLLNAIVATILILIRTSKEDQTLNLELHGYQQYSKIVSYRIIPGVW